MPETIHPIFLLNAEAGREYLTVTATVVNLTNEGIRNFSTFYRDERPFAELSVKAQTDRDSVPRQFYGWDVAYRQPHEVDLAAAGVMAKTLRSIQRNLDRYEVAFGRPTIFRDYLVRVAKALKIDEFKAVMGQHGGTYDEQRYATYGAASVGTWLNAQLSEFLAA